MAIWYVDLASGNDTTGNGSAGAPYKTEYKVMATKTSGDEIRVAKTTPASTISGVANFTFTNSSKTVTTSADATGSIAVGDYIGKTTATGNGNWETFYRVIAINATTITFEHFYYGTTATVSEVKKQPYVTCVAGYSAVIQSYVNGTVWSISGGWNLTNETQDGETWAKNSATRTTTSSVYQTNGAGAVYLSKMNWIECNRTVTANFNSTSTFEYCTFESYLDALSNATTFSLNNSVVFNRTLTGSVIGTERAGVTWTNVFHSATTSIRHLYINFRISVFSLTDCLFQGGSLGFDLRQSNSVLDCGDSLLRQMNLGVEVNNNSIIIKDLNIEDASGVKCTAKNGLVFDNISTTRCAYGIYSVANDDKNIQILGGTSTDDGYAVYFSTQYTGHIFISGRTFDGTTNYALYHAIDGERWTVVDCTFIDVAEEDLLYNPTGSQFAQPRYVLANCTGASNGQYFPYFNVTESTAVYRTTSPALKVTFVSEITTFIQLVQMWSSFADSTKSYSVSCYIKKGDGWTGSIIPVFTLNGREIQRETEITSLTTDWVQYTWNVDTAVIPNNGELSLGFILNANTVDFYFDDFVGAEVV